jgi:hypothetical protein
MTKETEENELLLPWLVNGTLSAEEKDRVESWLAANEDGEALRDFEATVRKQVRAEQVGSPGAFGLRRLQKAIAEDRRAEASTTPVQSANDNRWWKPAIAAAAMIILVQGGVILDQFSKPAEYQPLGVEQPAGVTLQVEFEPGATQQQISDLLRSLGISIVDGPAASGLYRLRLDDSATRADSAVRSLQNATGIVRYAEAE